MEYGTSCLVELCFVKSVSICFLRPAKVSAATGREKNEKFEDAGYGTAAAISCTEVDPHEKYFLVEYVAKENSPC